MRRHNQKGQALVFVVIAMGIFLIGSLGLAIDGGQLFIHRQMAQAAADAAAQAGIMSIFNGTNTAGATQFPTTDFTCTTTATSTPCVYARNNGFGGTATDTVSIAFPASVPGVLLWGGAGVGAASPGMVLEATVTRQVPTTLLQMVGAASFANVSAIATAAIVSSQSPIPIVVTHPTLSGALHIGGTGSTPKLVICGGPNKSIQVNSSSSTAATASGDGIVDLSKAGVNDTGFCTTGTGGDFGAFGGPPAFPSTLLAGADTQYIQPSSPILDPFATVPIPAQPGPEPGTTTVANGTNGCVSVGGCTLFSPGAYTTSTGLTVKNMNALFKPGLYYITQGGFNMEANSTALMATGFADHADTGQGMVVYNTGTGNNDTFNFVSNAGSDAPGIQLVGAPNASIYQGILFFQDPTATGGVHNGVGAAKAHSIQGGGTLSLTGTFYINRRGASGSTFQKLSLSGNPGSTTTLVGQIITNVLEVSGTSGVRMRLNPAAMLSVRQMALVR